MGRSVWRVGAGLLLVGLGLFVPSAAGSGVATAGGGRMLAWGYNQHGQLGDKSTSDSLVPVKVKLPTGVKVTSAQSGCQHTLALTSTGSVLAWGGNALGDLGNGSTTDRHLPVKAKLPRGIKVVAVSAGCHHSVALTSTGSVLDWGDNTEGELGDGSKRNRKLPVKVKLPRGTKVRAVAAGCYHTLAVTSTGSVLAWGFNNQGQLGNGSSKNSDVPVKVKLPAHTKAVAVGGGCAFSIALTSSGSVLAWGENVEGQLGDGSNVFSNVPVKVHLPAGTKVTEVAAGGQHSLALTSKGTVLAWGYNVFGELGDGSFTPDSEVPVDVQLPGGTKVTQVAAGNVHSLALTSKGSVLAWGADAQGELGNNSTTNSDVPVKAKLPAGTAATAVGAGTGSSDSLAIVK